MFVMKDESSKNKQSNFLIKDHYQWEIYIMQYELVCVKLVGIFEPPLYVRS